MESGIAQCSREKYWEEKSDSEKIEKLAEVVEILGKSLLNVERENNLMRQHIHDRDGHIAVPFQVNEIEMPWFRKHLLGRRP